MAKLTEQIDKAKIALADHDQGDYAGLADEMKKISALEDELADQETRWFELTEALDS
ncbi:hypothetical protein TSST111916_16850 [Tsukamurella strandjordii]